MSTDAFVKPIGEGPVTPSQIYLGIPPLVGMMGKAEIEFAAAMIVRALAARGDTWREISNDEIFAVAREDDEAAKLAKSIGEAGANKLFGSLYRNPFFRPDVHGFVAEGFGKWTNEEKTKIVVTAKGMLAMVTRP